MFKRAKGIVLLGKASLGTSPNAQHNLGWYATPEALQTAHPTANDGDFAIVGSTDTVWVWDGDTSAWVDTNTIDFANKNLSNLTATGTNIANWSTNVSNCVIEVPQDINLTLSDGTLTLKAGSKVYIPNGSGVFTEKTTTSDFSRSVSLGSTQWSEVLLVNKDTLAPVQLYEIQSSKMCSGSTDSLSGTAKHLWYDTTNNLIKYFGDDGVTNSYYAAFPLALIHGADSVITNIDQVFNGFGYIGSTVFALPGVSVATAAGRKLDGTLNSAHVTISSVKTNTSTIARNGKLLVLNNGTLAWAIDYSYDEEKNRIYNFGLQNAACAGILNRGTDGVITLLQPFKPFHAVDYNDTEFIGHQAMPSGRYTNLTFPTSGSTVTAPADGYFSLVKLSGAAGEFVYFSNSASGLTMGLNADGADINQRLSIPVSKGDVISINYNLTGNSNYFRFIYANGSK